MSVHLTDSSGFANNDLEAMRRAIANGEMEARRKGLRPVVPNGPSNQNHFAERDVEHLSGSANAEAPAADQEDGSAGAALVLGAAAVAGAASCVYNWWMGPSESQEPVAPVSQEPVAPSNNEAPPVHIFLPRDADDADLEAIRLAGLTEGDAALAQRLAEEDAQAAADAQRRRDEQIAADLRRAKFSQQLYDLGK